MQPDAIVRIAVATGSGHVGGLLRLAGMASGTLVLECRDRAYRFGDDLDPRAAEHPADVLSRYLTR